MKIRRWWVLPGENRRARRRSPECYEGSGRSEYDGRCSEGDHDTVWFDPPGGEELPLFEASSRLITDAEAFLSGNYVDHLRRHSAVVPGWGRLTAFAHGDLDDLKRVRQPLVERKPARIAESTEEAWRIALQVLAEELMDLVNGDSRFFSLVQRNVLVPLEFELMAEEDLTPLDLVQFTRAALRYCIP
jgi:hypothetical protein